MPDRCARTQTRLQSRRTPELTPHSYVYLAEDESSGRRFALKKIRCPLGTESLHQAMEEVSAYRRFRHPNLIRCLDSAVVQEQDGKIV